MFRNIVVMEIKISYLGKQNVKYIPAKEYIWVKVTDHVAGSLPKNDPVLPILISLSKGLELNFLGIVK